MLRPSVHFAPEFSSSTSPLPRISSRLYFARSSYFFPAPATITFFFSEGYDVSFYPLVIHELAAFFFLVSPYLLAFFSFW